MAIHNIHIHNWSLQPCSQDNDVASHTLYVVCVNFIQYCWDLQFKVDFERQIFEKNFHGNLILLSEVLPEICRDQSSVVEDIFIS